MFHLRACSDGDQIVPIALLAPAVEAASPDLPCPARSDFA